MLSGKEKEKTEQKKPGNDRRSSCTGGPRICGLGSWVLTTVKPVYNDHPKIVAVVDRWSLFRGHLCSKSL